MPQQTNLNVAPYFDDFDAESDYHQVLFKPGYPIQARELNNLQSILQNEIEKFGQHFFKEGAKVIPGNIGYTQRFSGIQLNNDFKGVPVSAYADQLVGAKITGLTSGVSAIVGEVLLPEDSERDTLTLYCNYVSSSTADNLTETFSDAEELTSNSDIISGLLSNTTIKAGAPFATTIATDAAIVGSSFQIEDGVYFVRGRFVLVNKEILILDQYGWLPSYRIGFYVDEQIITADQDETLNDNSQGFNNYAAPGANRLKISVSLFKKSLTDIDDNNFIELATVVDGALKAVNRKGFGEGSFDYDVVDTLARRTYDESGNYYVKPFNLFVKDSLNNNIGNQGVFQADQFTYGGSVPSDDLALYKLSPGKAYVKGYEVETITTTWIDAEKPRSTKLLEDQSFIYNTGLTLNLNRNYRTPTIGIGNTYYVSLRDERVGDDQEVAPGNEIGLARVYDYRLVSGSYNTLNDNVNTWGISLYDVQQYTNISLNQAHTLSVPTFIEGKNSGAKGFLRYPVSAGTAVTVYDISGEFIKNEELIFNGIENGRIALSVNEEPISNVRSIYGTSDGLVGINTFSADVVQHSIGRGNPFSHHQTNNVGIVTISAASAGISTVRMWSYYPSHFSSLFTLLDDGTWKPNLKVGDLIQYTNRNVPSEDPTISKVSYVSSGSSFTDSYVHIVGITTVPGVCQGALPSTQIDIGDSDNVSILSTNLDSSSDNSLFTTLPKPNISNVDLNESSITIRKVYTVNITSNEIASGTKPTAGTNESFLTYDEERYSLIRSDGTTEELTANKFSFNATATELSIRNLGTDDIGATLIATLKKVKPKAKKKIKNRVNSIIVDKSRNSKSGIGSTTADDGLYYGSGNYPYGTRVQDKTISLNNPDIIKIHAIYESADTSDPISPTIILTSIISDSNTTDELIIGELLIGQTSGSVAICAEKLTDSQIAYIEENDLFFKEGETVVFQESGVSAIVSTLGAGSFDISPSYTFNSGQKESFYNYGTIKRKSDAQPPVKRLKVYFENGYYDSTDEGDITTVNSYETYNYGTEIQEIGGIRNSDIIDIRPRVSEYTVAENVRSPLEFLGREFNGSGNSATNILASNENIIADFSYYQGRIDRVFLTKNGRFQLVYGVPSDNPQYPNPVDDSIEVATITLPPYLYNPEDARVKFLEHKRFQMKDIKKLEDRLRNLEYYTALSLLELNTANIFVPDSDGINRYKSGFFVDNFSTFGSQDTTNKINNSIDRHNGVCRPKHYTNAIDLQIGGPMASSITSAIGDIANVTVGTNIRKQENDVLTLDYADVPWIQQVYGTRSESVTPFIMNFWRGTVNLTPASDTWVDTVRLDAKIIDVEGDYAATMRLAVATEDVDAQTGFAPIVWDAWSINWTGTETRSGGTEDRVTARWHGNTLVTTTTRHVMEETIDTGIESREGSQVVISERFDRESVGDRVVSREIIPWMRSRNIEFVGKRIKPLTRMYAFFDGENVTKYCTPKLLEVTMTSGTFQVGETVHGRMDMTGNHSDHEPRCSEIYFRVAAANHREGPIQIPSVVYPENPYNSQPLPSSYSSTSTILNVDTHSLADEAVGRFYGWVEEGLRLVGQTSGATAYVSQIRLISDMAAGLVGSYWNPDPNCTAFPRFEAGTKTFTLISEEDNDRYEAVTLADEEYISSGTIETVQENIISVRNAEREVRGQHEARGAERTTGMVSVDQEVVSVTYWTPPPPPPPPPPPRRVWSDPLAQSFLVEEDTGVFITRCDVFFREKDENNLPVTFQIRTMRDGTPTEKILPFSEIVKSPDEVVLSSDGAFATPFEFAAPVYLEPDQEYAIVLESQSPDYSVYISRVGENDLITQSFVTNQPYLGSLFKSQNASTWEASQWEDLKFTLYRADFLPAGSVDFFSPELTEGNKQIPLLMPNSLTPIARKIRVGLGTTVADSGYEFGNTFFQQGTNATANLVGTAGTAVGDLTISNAGIGYTPNTGSFSFSGVTLNTLTGNGRGATGDITISDGVAIGATINVGGSGYQVGDVLGISNIGIASVGKNMRLTVAGIGYTSELILDNVQGNFVVGSANTVMYINSSGVTTSLNSVNGGDVQLSSLVVNSDGTHIKVNHKNHGMYADKNVVKIMDAKSDIKPTILTSAYEVGSVGGIPVQDGSIFSTFENVGVGTTNTGFLRIEDEIMEYSFVSGNTIGGITRGSDRANYPAGTSVYKYELCGVNLKRINTTHTLADATVSDPITLDSYHIKVDMSTKFNNDNDDRSNDTGYPALYLNETKSTGGYKTKATQNMPFELLTPIIQNVTTNGTSITGEVRTVTNSSISGNEIPFFDAGFESFNINGTHYFDTPRMIASKVNEEANMDEFEGNKSLNMRLIFGTVDSRISPVVDGQRVAAVLTTNRVNDVVSDYATDNRVNAIDSDPTAFKYLSKQIKLQQSATSLKILVDAHINVNCDIRAFYAIGDISGFEPIFTPFPGYSNLNGRGQIISKEDSNGESDVFISKSNEVGFTANNVDFKEYTFTADNLPSFRSYQIKIILTSKNQVYVPQMKDLRVIALA